MKLRHREHRSLSGVRKLTIPICLALVAAACAAGPDGPRHEHSAAVAGERHPVTGTIVAINPETEVWYVDHDPIPDYMDAMTMPFQAPPKETWPPEVAVDRRISATVRVHNGEHHLEDIQLIDDQAD